MVTVMNDRSGRDLGLLRKVIKFKLHVHKFVLYMHCVLFSFNERDKDVTLLKHSPDVNEELV